MRRQKRGDEKNTVNEFNKQIVEKDKSINKKLFKKYFRFQSLVDMQKHLYKTKNTEENIELVNKIKSGLSDLKDEIKQMSEGEIEIRKPYEIIDVVEKILDFNRQEVQGQGLKILTPNQMLRRLLISLAQLKAGNNLQELKNETKRLLYSLYRSKKISKTIYKYLISNI